MSERSATSCHASKLSGGIRKNAHVPQLTVPSTTEGHGLTVENGVMQLLWTDKNMLPKELADILEETIQEAEDASDTGDEDEEIEDGFLVTMMMTRVALKVAVTSLVNGEEHVTQVYKLYYFIFIQIFDLCDDYLVML